MTAAWIAYALLVGALLAGAALVAERALRHAGVATRWAWLGAMALLVALTALAPRRGAAPPLPLEGARVAASSAPAAVASGPGALARARLAAREAAARIAGPARAAVAAANRALPPRLGRWLGGAWLAASALLLALLAAVQLRMRRTRASWPAADLHGHRVRIAPDDGPAVVGLARPEIVVPRWLLHRAPDEQRIVLAHEAEHVRARDPLLLAAACAGVALLPWHPVTWWMLARMRLAVELDCDRRVLRRGIAPRSYGALLIDLAGRGSGLRHAAALADRTSHLERRLLAMTSPRSRFPLARGLALAALSLGGVLVACDTPLPTADEVEKMDVAAVEKRADGAMLLRRASDGTTTYFVDGERVDAERANAIAPERIASIEVRKGKGASEMRITTRPAGAVDDGRVEMRAMTFDVEAPPPAPGDTALGPQRVMVRRVPGEAATEIPIDQPLRRFDGLLLIDGVRAEESALRTIPPDRIVSVEIVKGARAAELYPNDPVAAKGVIRVTTKQP